VRLAATDLYNPSPDSSPVVIAQPSALTYSISLTSPAIASGGTFTFTGATVGYTTRTPTGFTLSNTGTGAMTNIAVGLSGANAGNFTLNTTGLNTTLASAATTNFTIHPNDGLPVGSYTATVAITDANLATGYTFTVHFTVSEPVYNVAITTSGAGTVTTDRTTAKPGETVTLTITPASGYELVSLSASGVTLNFGNGSRYSFTMPARDVVVSAVFQKTASQYTWESIRTLIEEATFTLTQAEASTETETRNRLVALINALISPYGFSITADDIIIYFFHPAIAGDATNLNGANGRFEFRISPSGLHASAYSSGTITATTYDPTTGLTAIPPSGVLKAWTQDGLLHVSGLNQGKMWQVYSLSGQMIYVGVAISNKAVISVPTHGIYIVTSGNEVVKTVY
jgi:uncharacterized membrane protein YeaQ/YmgE (transglycosylase-associated protein family)